MSWTTPITFPCGLALPNRAIMAPTTIFSSNPDGIVSDAELNYYRTRAATRPGAVITACAYVTSNGPAFNYSIGIHNDDCIEGLSRLAAIIKDSGTPAILQIFHAGRMGTAEDLVSASPIPALREDARTPRELTTAEVDALVTAFGDATRRAIAAGFDGVEIHGANTYLIQQFFSPHSNRRTDRWGGTTAHDRLAFPAAVIKEVLHVRDQADRPFAVGYRLSPEEIEEPGITLDDTDILVDYLVEQNLDYISISTPQMSQASLRDPAVQQRAVDRIAARVNHRKILMGAGGIDSRTKLENALSTLDLVAIAHQLIYDYALLDKIRENRETDVVRVLDPNFKSHYAIPDGLWATLEKRGPWFTFAGPALPPVISAAYLADLPDAIVVDSRWYLDGRDARESYAQGHLPGAVFVDLNTALAAVPGPAVGRHPLPSPEAFAKNMSALGISTHAVVVAYDDCGGQVAGRLVWMLRTLGVNAALLDGGIQGWTGELVTEIIEPQPVMFPVIPWPDDAIASIDEVAVTDAIVIDARAINRFLGEFEPVDPQAGHIPGAKSLPCSGNLDENGRFLVPDELRARFTEVGISVDASVVSYCGSGVTACHNLLALERAGIKKARLFPGSWSQWSNDPARPVAKGDTDDLG